MSEIRTNTVHIIVNFGGSFLPSWIRIQIPNTDPDPKTQLNTDPIRIWIRFRIRIHNPAFNRSRITTSYTKFEHVVVKLPEEVMISFRSLLQEMTPTTEDAYKQLKEALTTSYGQTRWQRGYAIINHPDLGDCRPSRMCLRCWCSSLQVPLQISYSSAFFSAACQPPCVTIWPLPTTKPRPPWLRTPTTYGTAHAYHLWDSRAGQSVASIAESVAAASHCGRSPAPLAEPPPGQQESPEVQPPAPPAQQQVQE
jgi:hypothetical protein